MNYSIEQVSQSRKKISFKLPKKDLNELIDKKLLQKRSKLTLKGFRPGHAPLELVRAQYAQEAGDEAINHLIINNYKEMLNAENLRAVSNPIVENVKLDSEEVWSFDALVDFIPELDFSNLSDLTVVKKIRNFESADMDKLKNEEFKKHCELEEVIGTPEEPALVQADHIITLKGFFNELKNEKIIQTHTIKEKSLCLEEDSLFSLLKENIIGMKQNEEKSFSYKMPQLAEDESLFFNITILDIQRRVYPEVNQEFLDIIGFKTVQDWEKSLKDKFESYWKKREHDFLKHSFFHAYFDKNTFELPATLIDQLVKDGDDKHHAIHDLSEMIITQKYIEHFKIDNNVTDEDVLSFIKSYLDIQNNVESEALIHNIMNNQDQKMQATTLVLHNRVVEDMEKRVKIEIEMTNKDF